MTNNKTIDELIDMLWLFSKTPQGRMSEEQDKATLDKRQFKQAITQAMLDAVGEDEPEYSLGNPNWGINRNRNQLRAEIRSAIKKRGEL